MLEHYKMDMDFAANIHRIAENTETISQSLAVIAGILSRREGVAYVPKNDGIQDRPIDIGTQNVI